MRYFLFILLVGLLSACSSDDESNAGATAAKLEVSKNEVKLSNVDGPFTINVTATSTWTAEVTSTGDWLTISKSSGEGMVISVCFYREYRRPQAHRNSKYQCRVQARHWNKRLA